MPAGGVTMKMAVVGVPADQQRKEVIVTLTRPSASESGRKRLSCAVRPGLRGSARLYDRCEWGGSILKAQRSHSGYVTNRADISVANDQVGEKKKTTPLSSPDKSYRVTQTDKSWKPHGQWRLGDIKTFVFSKCWTVSPPKLLKSPFFRIPQKG